MSAHNVYTPPNSSMKPVVVEEDKKLYSPAQAGLGAFFGGPIAFIFFIGGNYKALGDQEKLNDTYIWTLLGAFVFYCIIAVTPLRHGLASSMALAFFAQSIASTSQMKKEEIMISIDYEFHSNLRVVGLSILSMLLSLAMGFIIFGLAHLAGVAKF